jgi:hypothetical protein
MNEITTTVLVLGFFNFISILISLALIFLFIGIRESRRKRNFMDKFFNEVLEKVETETKFRDIVKNTEFERDERDNE